MVKELDLDECKCGCDSNMYQCESCGLVYSDSAIAQQCEEYCNKHQGCSIEITKHAVRCC